MEKEKITKERFIGLLREASCFARYEMFKAAAKVGELDICQICLDADKDILTKAVNENGDGIVLATISEVGFNANILDLLLKNGADINSGNCFNSKNALIYACSTENVEAVKYLIDKGAKPTRGSLSAVLDINRAKKTSSKVVIKLLLDAGQPLWESVLFDAVCTGEYEIVELLLQYKANPNGLSKLHDRTPLQQAVFRGEKHIVRLLLENGANVNEVYIRNGKFVTVMSGAKQRNDIEMQELLSSFGGKTFLELPDDVRRQNLRRSD